MADEKSQAQVMEFFITYSWALLVILVALGILVYFGLINVEGSTCKISPKLKCREFGVEQDKVVLIIQNKMDQMLLGVDVGVKGCDQMDMGNILDKEKKETFMISGCDFKTGEKVDTPVNFTYITEDGKQYTKIGKISAKVT